MIQMVMDILIGKTGDGVGWDGRAQIGGGGGSLGGRWGIGGGVVGEGG